MKRTLVLPALALGLAVTFAVSYADAQAAAAPAAPVSTPEATPTKVAVIAFEQAVIATNEGQTAVAAIQKKYEPKKSAIESQGKEIESLQKQVQALPASTSDEERATRLKTIDTKQKALQRDEEDASNSYQSDIQEAYAKVANKVGQTAVQYCQQNGFTMLINVGGNNQTPNPVLWFDVTKMDVTQAVVNAYNKSSGIAAPPPSAPRPAARPAGK